MIRPLSIVPWICLLLAGTFLARAAQSREGDTVIVVYNQNVPASRELADDYARHRQVPTNQLFGFDLPASETISRNTFQEKLQKPLFDLLTTNQFFTLSPRIVPATRERPGSVYQEVSAFKIRYAVLCYGVPVRIAPDTNIVETGMDRVRIELRRNEAAVDSELSLLPLFDQGIRLFGPVNNLLYGANEGLQINPLGGLLIVARLDGPSPAIARGLVDRALEAESQGLWGRAYFDARGLTNGEYKMGDEWIRAAAACARRLGFETVLNDSPPTFSPSFPLSHVALYAGWYDSHVSGPFTRTKVEFMPGAIAYHLHSFSGHEIRNATQYWVGPLLDKGATATMGCVYEPYLAGTPNLAVFFARLLGGFSFGEAAYASQSMLSWQTTVVGDPLYRPFARDPQTQHSRLTETQSPLLEWSHLRSINMNAASGMNPDPLIAFLNQLPLRAQSAVLEEKLAELLVGQNQIDFAIDAYRRVLKLHPSPQQAVRVELEMARFLTVQKQPEQAYSVYQEFLKNHPEFPEPVLVHQKLYDLARSLGRKNDAEAHLREINRLIPPAPSQTNSPSKKS